MKIKQGQELELVIGALQDFGGNRLPYRVAARAHNQKKVAVDQVEKREALRRDIVTPHLPEGTKLEELKTEAAALRILGPAAYREVQDKIRQLQDEEVDLDFGAPIDFNDLDDKDLKTLRVEETTTGILKRWGLLVNAPE